MDADAGADADAEGARLEGRRADLKMSRVSCCNWSGIGVLKSIGGSESPLLLVLGLRGCFEGWRGGFGVFEVGFCLGFLRSVCFGGILDIFLARYIMFQGLRII